MRTLLLLGVLLLCGIGSAEAAVDRAAIYPPVSPLWGTTTAGAPAVLWSEGDRMFNSSPLNADARSHWDVLRWEGDWLRYHGTYAVAPLEPTSVTFTPGIKFMPRYGDRHWAGTSLFTSQAGSGYVIYSGRMEGGHMTIREWLVWDSGYVTEWQEDYVLGPAGVMRTWGGNATGADSWDITFGGTA